jgi:hypothetical protein
MSSVIDSRWRQNALIASRNDDEKALQRKRRKEDAPFILEHPAIPWLAWVEMRNLVTHQYFRREAKVVWTDYKLGEYGRLEEACRSYLERLMPGSTGYR